MLFFISYFITLYTIVLTGTCEATVRTISTIIVRLSHALQIFLVVAVLVAIKHCLYVSLVVEYLPSEGVCSNLLTTNRFT